MKTIIEMAREADGLGFVHDAGDVPSKWQFTPKELERFVELIRADEREACAKVCEPQEEHDDPLTAWKIAKAIRARGNT